MSAISLDCRFCHADELARHLAFMPAPVTLPITLFDAGAFSPFFAMLIFFAVFLLRRHVTMPRFSCCRRFAYFDTMLIAMPKYFCRLITFFFFAYAAAAFHFMMPPRCCLPPFVAVAAFFFFRRLRLLAHAAVVEMLLRHAAPYIDTLERAAPRR